MQKHMFRKVSATVLTVAMLATSAFAASWGTIQGGGTSPNYHNGLSPDAPTKISAGFPKPVSLTKTGSGWDGVDNVPVMQSLSDGTTYAYVLYDGYKDGARLSKVDCATGTETWSVVVGDASGFQLSTPLLVQGADNTTDADDTIYAAVQYSGGSKIVKVSNLSSPTITDLATVTGQINTPVTTDGTYLYYGTWNGDGTPEGSKLPGHYFQMNINTPANVKKVSAVEKGFYWAGATVVGGNVYFGGDNGYFYYTTVSGFNSKTIKNINLTDYASDAGNVRSTVTYDGTNLYFTSQGGYLWCFTIGDNGVPAHSWHEKLGGTSTSTPTVTDKTIYVGFYQGFNNGGVMAVDKTSHKATYVVGKEGDSANGFPVQSSIVVNQQADGDYLYFNTNSGSGAGYCYKADGTKAWDTSDAAGNTYALGGMASCGGYMVFGNDYNNFYVVH